MTDNSEKIVLRPDEKGAITLCGGSGCCPVVRKIGSNFVIIDDDGRTVTMTDEQMTLLQNADFSSLK